MTRFQTRLLVEGALEPRVIALLENGGITPEVAGVVAGDVETLLTKKGGNPSLNNCLKIYEGRLFFRKRLYVSWVSETLKVKPTQVRRILDRWVSGEERYLLDSSGARTLWWALKTEEIEEVARIEGIDAESIASLNNQVLS